MRYHRLSFRRAVVLQSTLTWPFDEAWQPERVRLLVQARWRPDADVYETARTVEVVVDLAGVREDDVDIQLFEDVVVVEGDRALPGHEEGVYHAATIRRGPFRVEIRLPAAIALDAIDARYEGGLLRITLPKRDPSH